MTHMLTFLAKNDKIYFFMLYNIFILGDLFNIIY